MRAPHILLSLLIVLSLVGCAVAQPASKPKDLGIRSKQAARIYDDAQKDVRFRDWSRAIDNLAKALKMEPDFAHAHYLKGLAHQRRSHPMAVNTQGEQDIADARTHYARALALNEKEFPQAQFALAELLMDELAYDEAMLLLQAYLQRPERTKENVAAASGLLDIAAFRKKLVENPVEFVPENLGPNVNSSGEDYMPSVTADEQMLFFTSRREGNLGGWNRFMNDFAEDFYVCHRQEDGSWSPAQNLGPPINTRENEGAASFSQDGQWVYFTGCGRPDGHGNCDLYVARVQGNRWSEPLNMSSVINSPQWDSHPCISPDGQRLFFCSLRPGGLGGHDIWYSDRRPDGGWMSPVNIGEPINTLKDEFYPFLASDGRTLYFSSTGHPGMGKTDIFMSKQQDDGSWSTPKNLGYPINTPGEEHALVLNAQGTRGYTSSTRPGGMGKTDLYVFDLDKRIRPEQATFVRGRVEDSTTTQPIGATVQFVNLNTGDTVRAVESNALTGQFLLSLPLEEDYAAYVEAEGYLFYSQHFSLHNLEGQAYFDILIRLQRIEAGATVRLDNIFFDFDQATLKPESLLELNKLLSFLQKNPQVRIELRGHTDDRGTAAYNLRLSDSRAKAVEAWLVGKGISADRITAKGYGMEAPVADNATEAGRARNRRTEFRVVEVMAND